MTRFTFRIVVEIRFPVVELLAKRQDANSAVPAQAALPCPSELEHCETLP